MNLAFIVTGDRNATPDTWQNTVCPAIAHVLKHLKDGEHAVAIHGAARGIDSIAAGHLRIYPQVTVEAFPADWNAHGKAAGPIRNRAMLDRLLLLQREGYRCGVLAFHNDLERSKGTGGMVKLAKAAGVPVLTYVSSA